MKFSDKEIARYYDLTRDHYNFFWRLNQNKSLHYGYWDRSTKNFSAALLKINEVMAEKAEISDGMNILDAGCGEGGSVAWLASRFNVSVIGITLSKQQMKAANAYLEKQKLSCAKVEVQSYTNANFQVNHFDVVWSIESVCHAADKIKYLEEMYRVLKPGGKIVLADFFLSKALTSEEQVMINKWAHAWAVPSFEKDSEFTAKASKVGFHLISIEDITPNIRKSVNRLYRIFLLGLPFSLLYNLFHPNATHTSKSNVFSAYWQYVTFKRKLWNYKIIMLQKSA